MSETETGPQASLPVIGFIGVGVMGGPMACNLLKAGYPVIVSDLNPAQLERCTAAGATAADNAETLVRQSQIILTSLPSSAVFVEVAEMVLLPHAQPGQIFIDMGTTEAGETRRLAANFSQKQASLLDAPVSGGQTGAEAGTLYIFVGGEAAVAEQCRPLLERLGRPERVVYCGPSGSGQIVKGVNQLALGLGVAAYLEAMAFGVRAGVDLNTIVQAVGGTESWRGYLAQIAGHILAKTPEKADVKFPELPYFLNEAYAQGFDLPLTEALYNFCEASSADWLDNMNRPTVAFWQELLNRPGQAILNDLEGC